MHDPNLSKNIAQKLTSFSDEVVDVTEEDLKSARQELLKARALYQVRNNVIQSVLIANPILKAVHGSKNATIAEQ